jgi:hypothetical protein
VGFCIGGPYGESLVQEFPAGQASALAFAIRF